MIFSRYPAPDADRIFSEQQRRSRLTEVSDMYTIDAIERGLIPFSDPSKLVKFVREAEPVDPKLWAEAEQRSGHEIVGFLSAYLERLPEQVHPFVHLGLTSSDLTEYDLHQATYEHGQKLGGLVADLQQSVSELTGEHWMLPRAGRTHGQTAERTTLGWQLKTHKEQLLRVGAYLLRLQNPPFKTPGPTGFSELREVPEVLQRRAVTSTQIIGRDFLLQWACQYLRLSNVLVELATFIRLGCRSEIGEFAEGQSRVGSSAMPGKRNPIDSEKVCGLARVARGQFLAISEVCGLWEDRDLTNSSTERIAVRQLAAVVEHMTRTMLKVVQNLNVYTDRIVQNADDSRTRAAGQKAAIQMSQWLGPLEAEEKWLSE